MVLQTMCGLVKGAFSKSKGDFSFEVIDLLLGFDEAESIMQVRLNFFTQHEKKDS